MDTCPDCKRIESNEVWVGGERFRRRKWIVRTFSFLSGILEKADDRVGM
jgi:hypothetical protein